MLSVCVTMAKGLPISSSSIGKDPLEPSGEGRSQYEYEMISEC